MIANLKDGTQNGMDQMSENIGRRRLKGVIMRQDNTKWRAIKNYFNSKKSEKIFTRKECGFTLDGVVDIVKHMTENNRDFWEVWT